jgi:hypothetical protein
LRYGSGGAKLPLIDKWLVHWADPLVPSGLAPRRSLSADELGRLFLLPEMHGVLAAVLKNAAAGGDSSEAVLREAMARHHAAVGFSLMILERADALVRLLGNLPATIVKGPVFARRLYPAPELRRFTDIDVLVADDAIPALDEPLGWLGFRLFKSEPSDQPQEWKWLHRSRSEMLIEVHRNLVHAHSLRRAMSLRYQDIACDDMADAIERPAALLAIAGVHGATHNFERLLHVTDVLQAARTLTTESDESDLERLIARTGARFAVVAGLELAGRLFREERCVALARVLRPVAYVAGARWLLGRAVVISAMDRRRHAFSWRRTLFRELLKRPQPMTTRGTPAGRPSTPGAKSAEGTGGELTLAQDLTRRCRAMGLRQFEITIVPQRHHLPRPYVVGIAREHDSITISCQMWLPESRPTTFLNRLCPVLAVVGKAPSLYMRRLADISDGEDSGPGVISFCSRDPQAILIPDDVFVRTRGYEGYRHLARTNRTAWDDRSNWIVWRGLTTGAGAISKETLSPDDPELVARVRLCLALRDEPETNVRLHAIAQSSNLQLDTERLASAGILGDYMNPIAWCGLKFAIDIDGNTNAWSNFFTRLLLGCCVLKVASGAGYRQWYYGEIEPWIHYVPVKSDFADLRERIAWCRANLAECRQIAMAGQALAMARDYHGEIEAAARRVSEAYD